MRPVLLRYVEIMALCIASSFISCALYYYQIIVNTDKSFALALSIAVFAFILINIFMLRRFFREFPVLKTYYVLNYVAYGLFILTTVIVYIIFGEVLYAWTFSTLKLTAFMKIDHTTMQATALSHIIMLILIAVAPLDIHYRIESEKDSTKED